jgi:oligopeptide/dipeptide ABC transporter ATP-binding protein
MESLLEIKNLSVEYYKHGQVIPAVRGVDLTIASGEILGVAGESGCGKSTVALSLMRLIPSKQGKITGGQILLDNKNILEFTEEEIRQVRGGKIGIIFQEAFSSLNPVFSIGEQVKEAIKLHNPDFSNKKSKQKALEALQRVNIPSAEDRYNAFPHQLSGGMQQRAMIAMALSCEPEILIADEPTTALDVTIQAQILDLLLKIRKEMNMAILLITHNLAVVSQVADRVAIMYAGQIVEMAPNELLFNHPLHPYTVGLLNSVPDVNSDQKRLTQINGQIPQPENLPPGCPFHPRCPDRLEPCDNLTAKTVEWEKQHFVRCFKYSV